MKNTRGRDEYPWRNRREAKIHCESSVRTARYFGESTSSLLASLRRPSTLGRDRGCGPEDAMMFTYRCPACGKQHVVDTSFVNAFDAPCLRCREIVHVTEEIIYAADGTALASASLAAGRAGLAERVQPAIGRSRGGVAEGGEDGSAHKNVNDPGAVEKGHDADWAN